MCFPKMNIFGALIESTGPGMVSSKFFKSPSFPRAPFGSLTLYVVLGGSWTHRHDRTKMELMRQMEWCALTASCEVTGLFQPGLRGDQTGGQDPVSSPGNPAVIFMYNDILLI